MLVLSRKPNESIMIGDAVEVKIVEVKGDYVKLGITAPKSIPVHRKEIYEAIQRENIEAAKTSKAIDLEQLGDMLGTSIKLKNGKEADGAHDSQEHKQ